MTISRLSLILKALFLPAFLALLVAAEATPTHITTAKDPLAFAVIGDTGTGEEPQFQVARQMKTYRDKVHFDFVLMLGDNIYPDGKSTLIKARFEDPYKDLLDDGIKFYAVLGNHDERKGAAAEISYDKFHMDNRRYYSFTKGEGLIDKLTGGGLIEFFALDSTEMDQKQLSWLEDALKSSKARWKVAFFHHPIYSSGRKHGSDLRLRALVEPLFIKYKVDAVFAGHDHVYERVKPQNGVHYFTEGASGQLRKGNLNRRSGLFEAGNDEVNSFLIVQVEDKSMNVEAIGPDGKILDNSTINKE